MRYYEERGLLASERTSGGQRQYSGEVVARVQLIQLLYAAGLASSAVAELLPCIHTGITTTAQRALLQVERDRLDLKVAELVGTRDRLDAVITAASETTACA